MRAPSKIDHGASPRAVLVSEDTHLRHHLASVCESIGIEPVLTHSLVDAAGAARLFGARLVIVLADSLRTFPSALFETLSPGTPRLVMFGPRFGSVGHVLALELGFNEVWPADVSPPALNALLRSSMRDAPAPLHTHRKVSIGDFTVDPVGLTCHDGPMPVRISAGYLQTLALLVEKAPDVVRRDELRAQIPRVGHDISTSSRTVDVHVSRIRRQLLECGVTRVRIVQERGHGYRIVMATETDR